jgi:5'-3' exonuclease
MGLSLIFDGNYFFYKTLYAFSGYQSKGKRLLDDKKDQAMFMRKIATDMSHAIRMFGNPNKIVFTIDSHSWRKDVLIEEGSYKSNREKDETAESAVNWDIFYKCLHEFGAILDKKGFISSREPRAEGDDLMQLWSNEFYENGEDSVIITGDKDMYQCAKFNGKNFVIVYNPNSKNRKIVAPAEFSKWLKVEEYNLFDASTFMNNSKDLISEALNAIPLVEIDPAYVIFEKVLVGDGGDTVPSICTWTTTNKNGKVINNKLSEKMAERIYEIVNRTKFISDILDLPSRANEVTTGIVSASKQNPAASVIKSRLERNLQLVCLDNRIIPADIQASFIKSFESARNKVLPAANYDMPYLLGGTDYLAASKTFEADIFSAF